MSFAAYLKGRVARIIIAPVLLLSSLLLIADHLNLITRTRAAAFVVTNTNNSGAGSLRQAILDANAGSGADTITFSIGTGFQSIAVTSALPGITETVDIDASTQPGFSGSPLIELNGTSAGSTAGLTINAGSCHVRGLIINRFAGSGILIGAGSSTVIEGNYIGTNAAGTAASANTDDGIFVLGGSDNNLIGGTSAAARNIISGNGGNGISLRDLGTNNNSIQGNFIGTNFNGTAAVPNGNAGIVFGNGAGNCLVGGLTAAARNIISGNSQQGILIGVFGSNAATGISIQGNYVGADVSGANELKNNSTGIEIQNVPGITVGGTAAGARNIISGNGQENVTITGPNAMNNLVLGNYIGLNATGTASLGGSGVGLHGGANNNVIGGTSAAARNVISGNVLGHGIAIGGNSAGNFATDNRIQGNYIGLNAAGTAVVANLFSGVILQGTGVANNLIGGTIPGAGNVIAGNGHQAVAILENSTATTVQGNFMGTDATGNTALGGEGVFISQSNNNLIGGTVPAARNVISGNSGGININTNSSNNVVQGNFIGTNAAGTGALPNTSNAVFLGNVNNNTIGGAVDGSGNVIAFNAIGVIVSGGGGNLVLSNSIHSNNDQGLAFPNNGNLSQTIPVVTSASSAGGFTSIQGTLTSTPSTNFTIQFFANDACDSSGFGEGQTFIGAVSTSSNAGGGATFGGTFLASLSGSQVITATATDSSNNTSAFSACRTVGTAGFNITGRILDNAGNPIGGVSVGLNGLATTNSDSNGNYSFNGVAAGGNYTVTPASSLYSFSPPTQAFNNLDANRIANFVGTLSAIIISGRVADANNNGLNNVTLSLTRNGVAAGSVQTDGLGNYSFPGQSAGANYIVTPGGGNFVPASQSFANLTVNAVANFTSAPDIPPQCSTAAFGRTDFPVGALPQSIVVGDFNRDGKSDLAVANTGGSNVSILLGAGNGSFGAPTNFSVAAFPYSVTTTDFNGDGSLDLATASQSTNNVSVLIGNGAGGFGAATNFAVASSPQAIVAGDFNADTKPDLATANFNSNNVSILLGTGTGGFSGATNFGTGAGPRYLAVGDLNLDGKLDLAVAADLAGTVSILLGNGIGGFGAATDFSAGANPESICVGDFNGDSKPDLATANFNGADVSVLLGTGAGSFSAATNFAVGTAPESVVTGDFNADGKLDLAVANVNSNNVSVLLGFGTGRFSAATNFSVGNTPYAAAVGDFNSDGKMDISVVAHIPANVSILLANGSSCNTQSTLSISGRVSNATNNALADITVTLSGPITRVTQTDSTGNYSFPNLIPGGNYTVTQQSSYFVFAPSRADFFNLSTSQVSNFVAAPLAVPLPTPIPDDDFSGTSRDSSKWTIGAQTSSTTAFDPQVTTAQVNGQLVITPLTQATGMHYAGYVSANSFDLRNGSARVEVVKAGTGGADTIFAVGTDVDNFYRFLVHTPGAPTGLAPRALGRNGIEEALDTTVPQLIFQVNVNGQLTSLAINYDPVLHRFMRFRHVPAITSIVFETSPDNVDFTVQHTVLLQRSVSALTAELSAGTTNPANPGPTTFDNLSLVTSTFQFSAASYGIGESDGSFLVTVTRSGSVADAATVDFATADGTARQKTKYTSAAGTLAFASGIASRTFRVLLVDNMLAEGEQSLNLLLSNPTGAGLNTPGRAVLTISDNDTTLATGNPLDEARYYVTQHYYDFLSRLPDQGGLDFWMGQITQCGNDVNCLRTQRITVSNAFFYEQEYQQTGSYVVRLYRAAFGNNQPIPNNDANPQFPNENKKLVNYSVFSTDRARVRGGPSLAQTQLDLANAFVLRTQFLAKYPGSLDGPAYVDALIANINTDNGVNLSSERQALIDLFNQGGRGAVLYRIADDNVQTNPISNRAFIDAEYNRAFVLTQYFGYLRRNPDMGGYLFWLGQVNSAPLRALEKQRAMVCSFITSVEYQQRFSPVATHNNTECQ